jgi:hypothetical protein
MTARIVVIVVAVDMTKPAYEKAKVTFLILHFAIQT